MRDHKDDLDGRLRATLEALVEAPVETRERRFTAAVRAATAALAGSFAAALRVVPRSLAEEARQITLMEFFVVQPLAEVVISTGPQLLRTIFRRRIIDQIRRAQRYEYGCLLDEVRRQPEN